MKNKRLNVVEVCIILSLIIYPLIFTNLYTNLIATKYISFMLIAVVMFFSYTITSVFSNIDKNGIFKPSPKDVWLNLSLTDICMLLYLGATTISVVISEYKVEAFSGSCSNNMGLLYVIGLIMVYFAVSRSVRICKYLLFASSIGFLFLVIFALIQFMGFDLFGLFKSINWDVATNYISFLGNANIYSSYLCLMTPVFMCSALLNENIKYRIYYYFISFVGFLGLFCANSDGGYAGFFVAFLVILFVAAGYKERIIRFLYLGFFYCIASIVFFVLRNIFIDSARSISELTCFMTYGIATKIALVCFLLLIIILNLIQISSKPQIIIRKTIRIIIAFFIFLFVFSIIYINILNPTASFGFLDDYLKFNDNWGTGRGYVWKWSINIFTDAPVKNKLFGHGMGTCGIELLNNYGNIMKFDLGYFFVNSHNEYLEILINCGLFGLISYVLVILSTIIRNFKNKNDYGIIFSLGIIAYCIQSFFIVMQPIVHPMLFIFIGLANSKYYKRPIDKKEIL